MHDGPQLGPVPILHSGMLLSRGIVVTKVVFWILYFLVFPPLLPPSALAGTLPGMISIFLLLLPLPAPRGHG
jgi:hypothetical protein